MANRGGGRTEGRTDGRLEIPPCVLQDIGPLGPLPKKCENSHFYGILQQKMTLNDNGFTRYLVRICPRSKLLLFDPLLPIRAVLKHLRLKKV